MRSVFVFATLALASVLFADASPVPKGFESVDKVIKLGVVPGRMLFDKDKLTVKAGQKIKIDFNNNGVMPHNLIVLKSGGDTNKVGQMAMGLGANGAKMGYVPQSEQILASVKMINAKQSGSLYFKAPKVAGSLPYVCTFPGHFMMMKGVITVTQ
jgi:azurin